MYVGSIFTSKGALSGTPLTGGPLICHRIQIIFCRVLWISHTLWDFAWLSTGSTVVWKSCTLWGAILHRILCKYDLSGHFPQDPMEVSYLIRDHFAQDLTELPANFLEDPMEI